MEQIETQATKNTVRILIEKPVLLGDKPSLKPLGPIQQEKLPFFYRTLLTLTYPLSAASLFLAFTA